LFKWYTIWKLNCNSGALAGHIFFKMYHLPFGSFVYSVAFQFYNNNDTLKNQGSECKILWKKVMPST
jgi:hypothetical protein